MFCRDDAVDVGTGLDLSFAFGDLKMPIIICFFLSNSGTRLDFAIRGMILAV